MTRLPSLGFGEHAVIDDFYSEDGAVLNAEDREVVVTMMKMGVLPGAPVHLVARGMGGDPLAFNVRGALIALGKREAALIIIKKEGLA